MKINDIISESLDQPYKLDTPDHMYWVNKWSTKATSPTHTIKFLGKSTDKKKGPGLAWEFEFGTVPHRGGNGMQNFDKTGEGDAQRVFATAIAALKMFVHDVEPASVTFTADKGDDGASRTKLYQRMIQRLAPQMGFKPIVQKGNNMDTFTLVKEAWSDKYKKSIDCSNPKGFSQKAHCAGRKKKNEDLKKGVQEASSKDNYGIPDGATLAQLDKIAKTATNPEKRERAHWLRNMRRGKNKK